MEPSPKLTSQQLDDLQLFLKDWLRHTGRTQADLRRALRAPSIRMPVLLAVLQGIHSREGLGGLADHLCQIESQWRGEDADPALLPAEEEPVDGDPLDPLDLLLDEIRGVGETAEASWLPLQGEVS